MDYLIEIFKMQNKLEAAIGAEIFQRNPLQSNSPMKNCPSQAFVDKSYIGIVAEATEALENTPWKTWKESSRYNQKEFQKELIDAFHFLMNLFLAAGLGPQDVYRLYRLKHIENMKRNDEGY